MVPPMGSTLPQNRSPREWYALESWRKRRRLQLRAEPLCAFCLRQGITSVATIADHVLPHHGSWNLFRTGPLQSLCKRCHDQHKRGIELRGFNLEVDKDGWPTDPNHPANSREAAARARPASWR